MKIIFIEVLKWHNIYNGSQLMTGVKQIWNLSIRAVELLELGNKPFVKYSSINRDVQCN